MGEDVPGLNMDRVEQAALHQQLLQQLMQERQTLTSSEAEIIRLVDQSLGYLRLPDGTSLSFVAGCIKGYRGEDWSELGVSMGSRVDVTWDEATGIVQSLILSTEEDTNVEEELPVLDPIPTQDTKVKVIKTGAYAG